jgi:alkaline phosphatase D
MYISRRSLAKGSLALSCLAYQLRSKLVFAGDNFEGDCGVASGSPTENSVVLWTRVPIQFQPAPFLSEKIEVEYEVSKSNEFKDIVVKGTAETSALADFTVKARVSNLAPFTTYYYRFTTASGYKSVVGRTKTAPKKGQSLDSVKFGVVACQRFSGGFYSAYSHLANEDIDFCVHLGDHIYEKESGKVRPDETSMKGKTALTLEDFRFKYRYYLSDPAWREARRLHPWIDLWDDHEVTDNYSGLELKEKKPELIKAGYQAFCEYLPVDAEFTKVGKSGFELKIYKQIKYGDILDLFLLDQRQYRTDSPCQKTFNTEGCKEMEGPQNTMLGSKQKGWFLSEITNSDAKWKFVLSELVFSKFLLPKINGPELVSSSDDPFDTYSAKNNTVFLNLDAWDGYPLEREELTQHFYNKEIKNIVFLTGDVHSAYNSKICINDDLNKVVALEVVTAPISSSPLQRGMQKYFGDRATEVVLETNPWIEWADLKNNGYTVIRANREKIIIDHKIVSSVATPQANLILTRSVSVAEGDYSFKML